MSKLKKVLGYLLLAFLIGGLLYLYIWEKPKLEQFVKKNVESMSHSDSLPFLISMERAYVSIFPLQLEFHNSQIQPKKDLAATIQPFQVKMLAIKPSIIDLLVGKFWITEVYLQDTDLDIRLKSKTSEGDKKKLVLGFDLNEILKRIPISQITLQNIRALITYGDQYKILTENLFIKAYNEKSSLVFTLKDPNIQITDLQKKNAEPFSILADLQVMMTRNTISLSKLALIKESSYFISSGNLIYHKSIDNIQGMTLKSRIKSNFTDIHKWSNVFYSNDFLVNLKGESKIDIGLTKKAGDPIYQSKVSGDINQFQIGKIKLGNINLDLEMPNYDEININSITANLSGKSLASVKNGRVQLADKKTIQADLKIDPLNLHGFLKESTIADIPVWLTVAGQAQCKGGFSKALMVKCSGQLNANDLHVKNASRTKSIIRAKEITIKGDMAITETAISYKASAQSQSSKAESSGVIDFEKGFDLTYQAPVVNLTELSPIADLRFEGIGKAEGQVKGDSKWAIFNIDLNAENFVFQDYFFGQSQTKLNYKSGTLFFRDFKGQVESTRYQGNLEVDLRQERIRGDINLPFFRLEDVQQAIHKKVDLENRFLGSGSGRLQLDTSFDTDLMNFLFEARLFRGNVLGEEYNDAQLSLKAVDGIIIIKNAQLQKETTKLSLKGTIDQKLDAKIYYQFSNGTLQYSTLLKELKLPVSGGFTAQGTLTGLLSKPEIKFNAQLTDLIFNKKKYGDPLFSFDNSNNQMNLQFNFPDQMELLFVIPEDESELIFINLSMNKFDIAPLVGSFISDEPVGRYMVETSGEVSGRLNRQNFWDSEFSATIKDVGFHYKANRINKTMTTSLELKNRTLYMNEISFIGDRQFIKITQPETSTEKTKLIVNSRLNISLFKLFTPFFERIDGTSDIRLELDIDKQKTKLVGSAVLTDSFFKLPGFPHPFESMSADILFNQNKILINSMNGDIAGGKVIGSGELGFDKDKKLSLMINTNMEGVRINFPEGYKTEGDANITLSGSQAPFLLSGNYKIRDGLIDSNLSTDGPQKSSDFLEDLLRQDTVAPMMLNLDIATENSIEVRTAIGNAMVEGYIAGDFRVYDKIDSPRIKGEAHFDRNSVIRLRDNQFQVTSSSFVFEGENPINPKLSLRANTRVNTYDIDIFLQGRADKPLVNVSSQPPLPENQIISMLALGTMPDQFAQTANPSDAAAAATGAAAAPTTAPNSSGVSGTQGTNQQGGGFEIGTALLGTNPIGRELDQYGVDVQFSSAFDDQNNAAVPKVTVRKRIGRKIQLSGSHSSGNIPQTEGRLTYEIDNNLSTIFRITDRSNDLNNINNINAVRQNNPVGLDLEYRLEFD